MLGKNRLGLSKDARQPKRRPQLTYYRSRSKDESNPSPFERRKPQRKIRLGLIFSRTVDMLLVASLATLLIYSLIVHTPAVVTVNSTNYRPLNDYKTAVQKELSALTNRNKITFDEDSIIKKIRSQFPEISLIRVELPLFGQTPKVQITIAPQVFWLQSGAIKYLIDQQGVATATSQNLAHLANLTTVNDQSGFKISLGSQVLSSQSVSFINAIVAQCQHAGVPVSSLVIPAQAQELDLRTADRPYFVKFFMGSDPLLQSGQFLAARHQFDQSGNQPGSYLDVRVNGKVYFK